MKIFVIITGSEFTLGLKQEKNSLFICREALKRGAKLTGVFIVPDDIYKIQFAVKVGLDKSDIVIVSGGLGSTSDDITREAVSEAIGVPLIFDEGWLKKIKNTLRKQKRNLNDSVKRMAKIPLGARLIPNPIGKAAGFIKVLDDINKAIIVVPGVPSEMKPMIINAFNMIGLDYKENKIHLFRTFGLSEVEIDLLLDDIDNIVFNSSPKGVDIYVLDENPFFLENKIKVIRERLGDIIYSEEEKEMEEIVGDILRKNGLTVSTAESSTGGLISARIVNVPGSSAYFMGSIVSYSNNVKMGLLKVKSQDLEKHGAVSEPVAKQMAEGVRKLLKTDIALSDTGIAGPTGATPEKPIGLHYIGYCDKRKSEIHKVIFKGERNDIRLSVSQFALNLIRLNFR